MKLHLCVKGCRLPLEVNGGPTLHRIGLEIESRPGVQVRLVGRSFDKIDCSPSGTEWTSRDLVLTLGVTAASGFSPGNYELSAILNCDVRGSEGDPLPHKFSISIPLKVVPAHEPVKMKRPSGSATPWRVLLSPARLIESILFWDGS